MKRNLGKCSTLIMLLALTVVPVSAIASEDCRLDDGTSKEGSIGPAELLPSCAELAEAAPDTTPSRANETSQNPRAQKIGIVPVGDKIHESASVKQ